MTRFGDTDGPQDGLLMRVHHHELSVNEVKPKAAKIYEIEKESLLLKLSICAFLKPEVSHRNLKRQIASHRP